MKKILSLLLIFFLVSCTSVGRFGTGVDITFDPRTIGMQIDDVIMQKNLNARLALTEKKYLIETCSQAYKPFKKYLLFYLCYLFGAYFQQCKRHKIKFKFENDFLMIQLLNFRKMVEKFYKEPNKKANLWLPTLDDLFGKKDLDLNKNFFLAMLPPLTNQQLKYIVEWFIKNRKEKVVENVFYSAAHYFYLELDESSSFYKVKEDGEIIDALSLQLSQEDFKGFDKSILSTEFPIRNSCL